MRKKIKRAVYALTPDFVLLSIRASRMYRRYFGRYPNLIRPRTFTEKIQHRKVFDRDPRLPLRADKVLVKEFVANKIGTQYVIPTIWHGPELPPIEERTWPRPFVIKANHASGWNHFVRNDHEHDWEDIEQKASAWMRDTYGQCLGEWLYTEIKPQLIVEPFINEVAELPIDYKLWVFRGKVKFVQVDLDREHSHKRIMFDPDWKRLELRVEYPTHDRHVDRPASLELMVQLAQELAEDLPFVRVDFYEINGKPLFGEMTFYPDSGYQHFTPSESDREFGKLLG